MVAVRPMAVRVSGAALIRAPHSEHITGSAGYIVLPYMSQYMGSEVGVTDHYF